MGVLSWAVRNIQVIRNLLDFILPNLASYSPQELVAVITGVAGIGIYPGRNFIQSHAHASADKVVQFTLQQKEAMSEAFQKLDTIQQQQQEERGSKCSRAQNEMKGESS
eukprot:jgi/Chrzof1/2890/Cz12g02280.t1